MKEGHPSYRSQSDNPGKGTTLGGLTDDPRRKCTRDAAAGDPPRGRGERDHSVPRGGDLPDAVLSLATSVGALWRRWPASAASAGAAGTDGAPHPGRGAADPRRGDRAGDLGLSPAGGVRRAVVAPDAGAEHDPTAAATPRAGYPAGATA